MKLSTKAKRFSKAQVLGMNIIQGALAISIIACLLAPFIVSFGGAYESVGEFITLTFKLCGMIVGTIVPISTIPFVVFTFLKGLFS